MTKDNQYDTALPKIVSRDAWRVARQALLAKKKELTRARDQLNAERYLDRRFSHTRREKGFGQRAVQKRLQRP